MKGSTQAYTPDYNFTAPLEGFIPVLCGNYYFTGAYVYYFPDVSNLDFRTYGYQTNEGGGIAWFGSNYKNASEQDLTDKFISLAQSGYDWGGILEGNTCYPFIQHGTANNFSSDTDFKNLVYIKSVSISSLPDGESTQAYSADVSLTMDYPDWYTKYKYKYVLSGKGSGGLSVVDDRKGNATVSGTPTNGGSVTLTATVTDYSNRSISASTSFNVSGDSAAEVKSVVISPASSSATVGTAYTQQFTTTCQEGDDGSYSYSWSASGSTSGMSLDDATSSSPTLSGTPTTSGSITLTVLVTDSYGNKATNTSTVSIADAAPVYNHLDSVSVSPSTASATAGSSFSQVFTVIPSPSDDGSYTYTWNSVSDGLSITKNGDTATVSGVPTDAGSVTVSGFATDSYGKQHGASATITVEAATPTGEHLTGVSAVEQGQGSNPGHPVKGKAFAGRYLKVAPTPADDGTYIYNWYWSSGKEGGYNGMTMTGGDTAEIYWYGTPTESGAYTLSCDVTDVWNTTYTGTGTLQVDPS
ncbi:hypothetical protein UJ50_001704 [Salmonella enterica subsp. enterica]|nr:hypothetical protein [Salmonella enterica subsp. enterica]